MKQIELIDCIDVRTSPADRRRVERLIKNKNFNRGSMFIPNGPKANEYRFQRKPNKI